MNADTIVIERRTVGSATGLRCPACRRLVLCSDAPDDWRALNAHFGASPECQTAMADENEATT